MTQESFITASEIAEYVYCKRAWYLRHRGLARQTLAMIQGRKEHASLITYLASLSFRKKIAKIIILLAIILFGIGIVVTVFETVWS